MSNVTTAILIFLTVMKLVGMGSSGKSKGDFKSYVSKQNKEVQRGDARIAILPFENTSADPNAPKKFLSSLTSFVSSTGFYEVIDPGEVEKALVALRIRNTGGLDNEMSKKLGDALKCKGFLVGTIVEFGDVRAGNETIPTLSTNIRLLDAASGNIVWTGSVNLAGGSSTSLLGSSKNVTIVKLIQIASKNVADDLYKKRKEILVTFKGSDVAVVKTQDGAKKDAAASVPSTNVSPQNDATKEGTAPAADIASLQDRELKEDDLKKMIVAAEGFTPGEVVDGPGFLKEMNAPYTKENTMVRVRIVDYKKAEAAKQFVAKTLPGGKEVSLNGSGTGYSVESETGSVLFGMSLGQVGLYVMGAKKDEENMIQVAKQLSSGIVSVLSAQ